MKLNDRLAALPEAWPRRRLAWLGGAFIVAIAALAGYDIWRDYQTSAERTRHELDTAARVMAEQTARTVQAVDVMLRQVAAEHRRGRLARLSADELHVYLRDLAVGLNQIDGLGMFDANGDAIAVSWPSPRKAVNMAPLPRFQQLRDDATLGFVIFDAAPAAGDGAAIVPFGRRLETADGRFAGVVAARGRVDYFERFYGDAYPDPSNRVALLHRNATLLARHPPSAAALGRRFPLMEQLLPTPDGRPVASRGISPVDGVDRFAGVRVVPDYPLVVVVSRDAAAALAPWRSQALGSALRTAALGAFAALLIALVWRQFARLKAAGDSLAISEQRYALAAAGSDVGVWDWDLVANTAYESRRARELQGLPLQPETQPLDEVRGLLTYHPDDAAARAAAMQAHLDGATPHYELEYRVRRADGHYAWIHVRALCTRDAAGRPLRIAGSVSDIDLRKRAEAALRESEERYALAMTGSDEGHWLWDIGDGQIYVSAKLAEIFGFGGGAQTLAAEDYFARLPLHPDDRERVHFNRSEHLAGRTPRLDHEFRIVLGQGEVRWLHTRAQCFRDADGRPLRLAGATVDVTARKRAELETVRLEEQLRQAQKLEAIGTLAGGIAHDFNNILSAILGYGELAQKNAPEGTPLRRHIDASIAAGQRAKSLVERILAFSRSGMGERVPVHVQSVMDEALDAVAGSLPSTVTLTRTLDAGPAGVLGDPTQIHQVVMNLCANAVQAMRSAGRLEVRLGRTALAAPLAVATSTLPAGDYLVLAVADTGAGIAPELRARIFDPFFTTKEVGVGTGLGLSLVHGIVTDLGGGIEVESRVGLGSRFTVYLPVNASIAAPAADTPRDVERGEGQVVLLVDDEEALVRLGEETLAEIGYEPVGFTSPTAALDALRAEPQRFDILLSDEAMPGLTGTELARAARALRPELPVVLASGYVTPALLARARDAGVAEVLSKPLAAAEVARALAAALRGLKIEAK